MTIPSRPELGECYIAGTGISLKDTTLALEDASAVGSGKKAHAHQVFHADISDFRLFEQGPRLGFLELLNARGEVLFEIRFVGTSANGAKALVDFYASVSPGLKDRYK